LAHEAWESTSGKVQVSTEDGVGLVSLARPDKLNALTIPMLRDVARAIRIMGIGGRSKGMVFTGTGRAFSAGDDLAMTESLDPSDFAVLIEAFQDVTRAVLETEVPVVAALNGIVVGGAAEMVLACDARVGCATSEFFFPENGIGLTISNGSTYLLPRLLGGRALPLVLDGRRLSALEARDLGLIDYIVEGSAVVPHAIELIHRWGATDSSTALHLSLLRPQRQEVERAMQRESEMAAAAWHAGTVQAGVHRFLTARRDK
jgi:enoyl-CoA hydratase/carnithine racemase